MSSAPQPNRVAIEAELTAEELVALRGLCALFNCHPTRWPEKPPLQVFATAAVVRLRDRLVRDQRLSLSRATVQAATSLGLNGETMRTRVASLHAPAPRAV